MDTVHTHMNVSDSCCDKYHAKGKSFPTIHKDSVQSSDESVGNDHDLKRSVPVIASYQSVVLDTELAWLPDHGQNFS